MILRKRILEIIIGIMVIVSGLTNIYISDIKNIEINDNGTIYCFKTNLDDISDILKEKGISLSESDEIYPYSQGEVSKNQTIKIKRSNNVTINADGKSISVDTCEKTVYNVLESNNIKLNDADIIDHDINETIKDKMVINIVRVNEEIEKIIEKIPFNVIEKPNSDLDSGKTILVSKGIEGENEKQYYVKFHDDVEIERELISEEIVKEAQDEVIEFGTVKNKKTSRGDTFRYTKVLDMRATAYDLSYESCGKTPDDPLYGITYTGMKAKHGVVAVDPNVIPLYSRLYIEAADGSWVYGFSVAGDTGGAVKGNIIDLFYDDPEFVKSFGVKPAKVYILK
jgi:uncharacterized protein YabE (DUF348 family)